MLWIPKVRLYMSAHAKTEEPNLPCDALRHLVIGWGQLFQNGAGSAGRRAAGCEAKLGSGFRV